MDKLHSGIFMIDIDRNGPLPPAHVICDLLPNADGSVAIRTTIEHNLQHQVVSCKELFRCGKQLLLDVLFKYRLSEKEEDVDIFG